MTMSDFRSLVKSNRTRFFLLICLLTNNFRVGIDDENSKTTVLTSDFRLSNQTVRTPIILFLKQKKSKTQLFPTAKGL